MMTNVQSASADLTYRTARTAAEAQYMARHFDRNGTVEVWFPSRDDRTRYILAELRSASDLIGWEDPANDCNMSNVYGPGKDIR